LSKLPVAFSVFRHYTLGKRLFTDEDGRLTAVDQVFGGHTLSVFHCHECGTVSSLFTLLTTVIRTV